MNRSPLNLSFHELIGLHLVVRDSSEKTFVSRSGLVLDETKNVLRIRTSRGIISLPKSSLRCDIRLPNGESVSVNGNDILSRPEDRISKMRRSH